MGAEKIDIEKDVKIEASNKILSYDQVPKYRRNWFAILMFFIFPPAFIYLVLTGDIFYERKGELKTYSIIAKVFLALWAFGYMMRAILK